MQVYQALLVGAGRPFGGKCPRCGDRPALHAHGSYRRFRGVEGKCREQVPRFICPRCRRTWSVIPEGMMPYRSMEVGRWEALSEQRLGLADGGARPPPTTEKEEGCIRRSLVKLSERIPLLCGLFGQRLPVLASKNLRCFWRALRELGSTMAILLGLARDFKTSLLGCYRSLLPNW